MRLRRREKANAPEEAQAERGRCVVCLQQTGTGCVVMGPPEWTADFLSDLGVHPDSVPGLIEQAVGDDGPVYWVSLPVLLCGDCSSRNGSSVMPAIAGQVPIHAPRPGRWGVPHGTHRD